MHSTNYTKEESRRMLHEITERRKQYESEKLFDYNIEDYDNWSAEWYEEEDPGFECSACFGTGMDRYEDADCLNCYGEGRVYGTVR